MLLHDSDNWSEFRDQYLRVSEVFLNTAQDGRKALYNCYKKRYAWNYKWLSDHQRLLPTFLLC